MDGNNGPTFLVSLLSGAIAGTTVDVALFPLDTIKTRLQAPGGFWRAGGFNGIYKGLSAAAVGSAPGDGILRGYIISPYHRIHLQGPHYFSVHTKWGKNNFHNPQAFQILLFTCCLLQLPKW